MFSSKKALELALELRSIGKPQENLNFFLSASAVISNNFKQKSYNSYGRSKSLQFTYIALFLIRSLIFYLFFFCRNQAETI